MRRPTLPRKIYDFFNKNWFLSFIAVSIYSLWFTFLHTLAHETPFFSDGKLALLGHLISWPLLTLSLVFAYLKSSADNYNSTVKEKGGYILQRLLEAVNSITNRKANRFCNYVHKYSDKLGCEPFMEITQPRAQIDCILDNIQITLSSIFGIERDNISLSIIYQTDKSDWNWLTTVNINNDLSIGTLLRDPSTTAYHILNDEGTSIFYPDKRIAIKVGKYLGSRRDNSFDCRGSILCRELSVGDDKKYLRAILSISTFRQQICEQEDNDAIEKIEGKILPVFEERLRLELALLYIKEMIWKEDELPSATRVPIEPKTLKSRKRSHRSMRNK